MTTRFPCRTDDFCLIHGSEHMVSEPGNPIPFCTACADEKDEEPEHPKTCTCETCRAWGA